MALELKNILSSYKKEYNFVIKIARDINDKTLDSKELLKNADIILKAKGMTNRTNPKQLPLSATKTEFKRLCNWTGLIYRMEMTFEYPITAVELRNELSQLLDIGMAYIIVRTTEDPLELEDDTYLEYSEEEYIPQLLTNTMPNDVNEDDLVGDEYGKQLVKALGSKEAKKFQHQWKDLDMDKFEKALEKESK